MGGGVGARVCKPGKVGGDRRGFVGGSVVGVGGGVGSAGLFFEDSSRSVKANHFAASANICMPSWSLPYPRHCKCFSFALSVYRNGRAAIAHPSALPHSTQSNLLWPEHTFSSDHLFEANT